MKALFIILALAALGCCTFPGEDASRFLGGGGSASVGISIAWPWDSVTRYSLGGIAWTYPAPPAQKYVSLRNDNRGHDPKTSPQWWKKQ